MIKNYLNVYFSVFSAIVGFSQNSPNYIDIERQINNCITCQTDTIKLDNDLIEITYKDSNNIKINGRKIIDDLNLVELVWNTNDIGYAFMFEENNRIYFTNVSIIGVAKFLTYYNPNGSIAQIEQYDDSGIKNGWQIEFADNGELIRKSFFLEGKEQNK